MQLQPAFGSNPKIERLYVERETFQRAHAARTTLRGYAHDWKHFAAWCDEMQRCALPATPDTLSLYITDLLLRRKKVTTAARIVCGVAYTHRQNGAASPVTTEVRNILWGARRLRLELPRQMKPLTLAQVREIAAALESDGTPRTIRDRALVVLGFASALRRSNLAALLLGEIEFCAEGLRIRVRREKQDPAGLRRRIIGVPYGQDLTFCPVGCLHAWLNIRGTESGPLFTRLDPARDHDLQGLSLNGIARVVKAAVARIGLDPTLYGPPRCAPASSRRRANITSGRSSSQHRPDTDRWTACSATSGRWMLFA